MDIWPDPVPADIDETTGDVHVACPKCDTILEIDDASDGYLHAQKGLAQRALMKSALDGKVTAQRIALEVQGVYTPKQIQMNVNVQANKGTIQREHDIAIAQAILILATEYGINGKQFDRVVKEFKKKGGTDVMASLEKPSPPTVVAEEQAVVE